MVVFIAVVVHIRELGQPLGGDDVYVVEALRSSSWWHRLFAFDMDAPGADHHPWWTGGVVQRRFIRVPASALLWLESHLFGVSPVAFSAVTLALVLASCLLIHSEAARHLPRWKASMIALVPAVHPATAEAVAVMNRQPIATAGLFGVAAAISWIRMRERFSIAALAGTLVASALAVTAYEAAIALPFALLLADLCFERGDDGRRVRWGPRLGLLFVVALYVPFAIAIRRGLSAPDTTSLRRLGEVVLALRYDTVAYVLKAIGLFDPRAPASYWFQRLAGEPVAIAVSLAVLIGLALRFGRERLGWVGLAVFTAFLAVPLVTRAAVSVFNFPTLRQLYLPILLGGPLMMAGWLVPAGRASGGRKIGTWLAGAWLVALAVQSLLCADHLAPSEDAATVARVTAALLDGVPRGDTIVGIGEETCRFSPSLVRDGPAVLAIPAGRGDTDPELIAAGPRELIARAIRGFDILEAAEPPKREAGPGPGPAWITRTPPPLVRQGWQRITGATVTITERDADRITALRYDFDEPLETLVFLRFRGCAPPTRAIVRDH